MSKGIKKIIKRTRHALRWRVLDAVHDRGEMEIVSDPWERTHIIYSPAHPAPGNPLRDIEYLHELAHAMLCETVHTCMSTHYFEQGTPEHMLHTLSPIVRAASDWYADGWLMSICPDDERSEIEEHYALVCRALTAHGFAAIHDEWRWGAALIIAQAVKWCGRRNIGRGALAETVNVLLAIDPMRPSRQGMERLINDLLSCSSMSMRIAIDDADGTIEVAQ